MSDEPWDVSLATKAAVIKQMETLGAVKLDPHKRQAGFTEPRPLKPPDAPKRKQ